MSHLRFTMEFQNVSICLRSTTEQGFCLFGMQERDEQKERERETGLTILIMIMVMEGIRGLGESSPPLKFQPSHLDGQKT